MPKGVKTTWGPRYPDGARVSLAEVKAAIDRYLAAYAELIRLPLSRPSERKAAWQAYLKERWALAAKLRHWGLRVVHRGLAFMAKEDGEAAFACEPIAGAEGGSA